MSRVTPPNRMMSITITIGKRYPAHSTSLGWVLLGGLDDADAGAMIAEAARSRR
jgi:IclR family transcriptional regulator, pca regulon regulatory protein